MKMGSAKSSQYLVHQRWKSTWKMHFLAVFKTKPSLHVPRTRLLKPGAVPVPRCTAAFNQHTFRGWVSLIWWLKSKSHSIHILTIELG